LKLFFRCGEPESARWVSDTIGEVEIEKPKIGTTASVEDRGRDSLNYSTVTEHKPVISKEEIMSLADLHGYWKYHDAVVPFRLPLAPVGIVARGYVPRRNRPSVLDIESPQRPLEVVKDETIREERANCSTDEKASPSQVSQERETEKSSTTVTPEQRKFEFSIAEKGKQLVPALEETTKEESNRIVEHSTTAPELSETALSTSATEEIGPVDPELEFDHVTF
jgi:hypothetical protein